MLEHSAFSGHLREYINPIFPRPFSTLPADGVYALTGYIPGMTDKTCGKRL
jgi:hypothetical protein